MREVAEHLTEEMVTEDKSLITIYYGEDVSEEDAQTLLAALSEKYSQCDVDLQHGGQPSTITSSRWNDGRTFPPAGPRPRARAGT